MIELRQTYEDMATKIVGAATEITQHLGGHRTVKLEYVESNQRKSEIFPASRLSLQSAKEPFSGFSKKERDPGITHKPEKGQRNE